MDKSKHEGNNEVRVREETSKDEAIDEIDALLGDLYRRTKKMEDRLDQVLGDEKAAFTQQRGRNKEK